MARTLHYIGSMIRKLLLTAIAAAAIACSSNPSEDVSTDADESELAACPERSELLLWSPNTPFTSILDQLTPNLKCTHWYVGVPLVAGEKTSFHAGVKNEIDAVHKRGSNFHVLAEFQWTAWRQWTEDNEKSWYEAGVEFRRRMDVAGFDVHYGDSDTWAINEIPSTVIVGSADVTAAEVRKNVRDAIRGLFDGPKKIGKKGVTYRVGSAHDYTDVSNLTVSKKRQEAFLQDDAFWADMSDHVRWWADEVYADPLNECVPNTTVAERSRHINDYVFHLPALAEKGPASVGVARAFLRKTFTPLLNAAWQAPLGYGRNDVSAENFGMHVSTEVYAVRAWQAQHPQYGRRMGFGWAPHPNSDADKDSIKDIGARLGRSVDDAFAPGHGASYACSPSGAYTNCVCRVGDAKFIETWANVFATW